MGLFVCVVLLLNPTRGESLEVGLFVSVVLLNPHRGKSLEVGEFICLSCCSIHLEGNALRWIGLGCKSTAFTWRSLSVKSSFSLCIELLKLKCS